MTDTLMERLKRDFSAFTRAEKMIANYMLAHRAQLPFDTAASIAESAGVSQMTVSRFLRTIGYPDSNAFKAAMRAEMEAGQIKISDRVSRIRRDDRDDSRITGNLELETRALLSTYEQRSTPAWSKAVEAITCADRVGVSGFQTVGGIASDFAGRLSYLRPEVRFLDGADGTFAEIFGPGFENPCIVLFEMRRYTHLSLLLARSAAKRKVPLVIVCDTHCHWAWEYTDIVFALQTESTLFWDTQIPLVSLGGLLLDDVIAGLGNKVQDRVNALRGLQDEFEAFDP